MLARRRSCARVPACGARAAAISIRLARRSSPGHPRRSPGRVLAIDVRLPQHPMTRHEAMILRRSDGDRVEAGEPIARVGTARSTAELGTGR
jgi:hypothetical protein